MRLSTRYPLLIALAIFLALSVAMILLRPLLAIDETRYVTVSWEMWQGGSSLVPHLNGEIYGHKPPLLFWLITLVWQGTGVSETAARMVGPAFGALAIWLTYRLSLALWPRGGAAQDGGTIGTERAGAAALILGTGGIFLLYGSMTMFDTMLTCATLIGMLALVAMRRAETARKALPQALLLGAAIGFGVYAKGPVILLHLMPAALLMPLWATDGPRPPLQRWYLHLALAIGVALALVALWLAPALIFGGAEYREEVLWRQSAGRMVSAFDHRKPFWFFLALSPFYLWPWGWSRAALARLSPLRLIRSETGRLLSLWILAAFVAFSLISSKQAHYLMPELPALALLLAPAMPYRTGATLRRLVLLIPAAILLIAGIALTSGIVSPDQTEGVAVPFLRFLAAAVVFALLALFLWRAASDRAAVMLAAPGTLLMLHLLVALPSGQPIADWLSAHEPTGIALTEGDYQGEFTFLGRLTQPMPVLETPEAQANWLTTHPAGAFLARNPLPGRTAAQEIRFRGALWHLYSATP
jgi:4-amino-4-deoxy-L-arabinose transferase-like glycosyltransferase